MSGARESTSGSATGAARSAPVRILSIRAGLPPFTIESLNAATTAAVVLWSFNQMIGPVSALNSASPGGTEFTMALIVDGFTLLSVAGSMGEFPCFAEMMISVDSNKFCSRSADTIMPID